MAFLKGEVGDRVFKSNEETSDPRRLAKLPGILSSGKCRPPAGFEWQRLADTGLVPRRRPKSYSPVPGRSPDCASPMAPSADNLAVEGRFKEEVFRIRGRRIEGEDGLLVSPVPFRSGNIDSDATSVGWPEIGRRVAATPEPLLPRKGEMGCFNRGDNWACSEILSFK